MKSTVDHKAAQHRLTERRQRVAEHRWRCYDFGSEIFSHGKWTQHGRDDGHWRRPVNLRTGYVDVEVTFAVTFAVNTNHLIEAYAEIANGPPLLVGRWSDDERAKAAGP